MPARRRSQPSAQPQLPIQPRPRIGPPRPAGDPPEALSIAPHDLEQMLRHAVRYHWQFRDDAAAEQAARGTVDAGTRGTVTAGKHLDGFRDILGELADHAGYDDAEFSHHYGVVLPGYYRATKAWDFIVIRRGVLVAAVEFKSMVGSVGNNLNNRGEEVLGLARDFWAAYLNGLLMNDDAKLRYEGTEAPRPWIGYVYLIGDDAKLENAVKAAQTRFPTDPEFDEATYIDRFKTFCLRMQERGDFNGVCFLRSERATDGRYAEPHTDLGFAHFAQSFYAHLVGWQG